MLNSLSDQADAQWTETKYLGRADAVHTYEGFTRMVSLDTTLVAMSLEELHPMWQKINYLVGLTKLPGYTDDVSTNTSALDATRFIIPPFIKFNLGDIYSSTLFCSICWNNNSTRSIVGINKRYW